MIRRPALLAIALVALAALSVVPAHADTWSASDERGDAGLWTHDTEPEPCGTDTETPTDLGDLRRLSVRHTRDRVVLRMSVSGLATRPKPSGQFTVRTERRDWWVDVVLRHGRPEVTLSRAVDLAGLEPDECGAVYFGTTDLPCADIDGALDVARGVIRASVPRRCLRAPRWVRAAAQVTTVTDNDVTGDYWAPRGTGGGDWLHPTFGPRVRSSR